MFGYTPFSELPFATIRSSDQFESALASFFFSRFGFVTSTADTPSQTLYDPRVLQPLQFDRSIINGDRLAGISVASGEIALANGDGKLDNFAVSHAFDGRDISVSLGESTFATTQFGSIFKGVLEDLVVDEDRILLNIRDRIREFELPIQPNTYAGSGGEEGGEDLEGKPKPLAYGVVRNVSAVLVDAVNLVYQVHDGQVNNITAVYDRGVELSKTASTSPGLGEFHPTEASGVFKLGGAPDGTITADVEGDASSSFITKTGEIVERILLNQANLTSTQLNTTTFDKMNADSTGVIGIWVGPDQRQIFDVVDQLLISIGAYGFFNRDGKFTVGVFKDPNVSGDVIKHDFKETDIISIRRDALPTVGNPPIFRSQVTYKVNYTVQEDLAGGSSVGQRQFAVEPFRVAVATDLTVKNRFKLADDPDPFFSLYDSQADAQQEAQRLLDLFSEQHYLYEIVAKINVFDVAIGDVVFIQYPRWELTNGRKGRVVALTEDAERHEMAMTVFV